MKEFTSLHNIKALKEQFAKLPKPKTDLTEALNELTKSVDAARFGPFKLTWLEKLLGKKVINERIYAACWELIRPAKEKSFPMLEDLRIRLGLTDKFDNKSFYYAVKQKMESVTDGTSLIRWMRAVCAEIEFEIFGSECSNSIEPHDIEVFHRSLIRIATQGKNETASHIVKSALEAAAATFVKIVAPKENLNNYKHPPSVNANLMISALPRDLSFTNTPAGIKAGVFANS